MRASQTRRRALPVSVSSMDLHTTNETAADLHVDAYNNGRRIEHGEQGCNLHVPLYQSEDWKQRTRRAREQRQIGSMSGVQQHCCRSLSLGKAGNSSPRDTRP